jgi:hypothetical protein
MNLHSNGYNRLLFGFTAANARLFSANIGFIDLDLSGKAIAIRTHHRVSHLMQPSPRRLIAAEPNHPLKAECITPVLLARYMPHRLKPRTKRFSTTFKKRTRSHRRLTLTNSASKQSPARQPCVASATVGTSESFRPTQPSQEFDTPRLRRKPFVKFLQSSWVIFAAYWVGTFAHSCILHLVPTRAKWIPHCFDSLLRGSSCMHRSRVLRALGSRAADKPPPISAGNPMRSAFQPAER